MALRTWGRVLVTALAVGLLASTSQLGVAFGLGIVRLDRTFAAAEENQWVAQLAWITWFPIVAAVAGAVAGNRRAVRHGYHGGTGSRILYSIAASVGAAAVVPLAMLPARGADVPTGDPVLIIGLSAGLGTIAGLFAAIAVLSQDALFWNVVVVTAGAWLLGLISMGQSLGDPQPAVRLGVYDPTTLSAGTAQRLGVVTMPLLALAAGAITAGLGRWLSRPSRTLAAAGVVGPAMLSLAYLVAGPGTDTDKYQAAPYWGSLVAVAAGALGSMLATTIRRPVPADPSPTPDTGPDRATPDSPRDSAPDRPSADRPATDRAAGDTAGPDRGARDRDFGALDQAGRDRGAATPGSPAPDQPASKPPLRKRGRRGSRAEAFAPPGPPAANPPYTGQEPSADRQASGPPLAPEWAAGVAGRQQGGPARNPTASEAAAAFSAGRQAGGGKAPDVAPALPEPDQAKEKRPRRGLFGRRKSAPLPVEVPAQRVDEPHPEAPAGAATPLPPRDEEYVDWVNGLSDRDPR
jgi:hypothetical protein